MNNDWRLTNQTNYLRKKRLIKTIFQPESKEWDHEHCQFCCEKISVANKSYATEDKYYWICPECFEDFKEMFEWTVEETNEK